MEIGRFALPGLMILIIIVVTYVTVRWVVGDKDSDRDSLAPTDPQVRPSESRRSKSAQRRGPRPASRTKSR